MPGPEDPAYCAPAWADEGLTAGFALAVVTTDRARGAGVFIQSSGTLSCS